MFFFDFGVKCGLVCDPSVRFITLSCNIPVWTFISLIHSYLFNRSDTEVEASAEVSKCYFNTSKCYSVIGYVAELLSTLMVTISPFQCTLAFLLRPRIRFPYSRACGVKLGLVCRRFSPLSRGPLNPSNTKRSHLHTVSA